ncbi:MAG: BspA family leucine-rich repeat surface protein, partial [Prevotella sp.]|nr:BspA family leucine-rich repeat surface protein [Prevotella sp.]
MKRKLFILWLMLLVGAAGLHAAEAYTYFDPADGSLNFCYDTNRTSRKNNGYNTYDLNTGSNTPEWYSIRSSVKELYFYSAFSDYRPTTCYRWAYGMSNLTKVTYINRLNTSQVTNMADMFNGCSSLTTLDLGYFDTSNVTTMYRMFYGCTKLEYVDLYSELFMSPSGESSYESTFVTSKVGDMQQMFYNCSSLKSLAFPGLSLKSTTKTTDMFYKCTAVTNLYVANDLTAAPSTTFAGLGTATKPVSLETVVFPSNATFTANYMLWKGGYFIDAIRRPFAVFDNGALSFYYENPEWAEMVWSETFECYSLNSGTATPGWSSKATSVTKVEFKENFKYVRPTSCYKWF